MIYRPGRAPSLLVDPGLFTHPLHTLPVLAVIATAVYPNLDSQATSNRKSFVSGESMTISFPSLLLPFISCVLRRN